MEYLFQFMIIAAVSFAGELLHSLLPLPIPAGIYGLVLLFVLLTTGLVKLERVKKAADFLLAIMPVMFVAPSVGLMDIFAGRERVFLIMALISVASTVAVMAAAGHSAQLAIRLEGRRRNG